MNVLEDEINFQGADIMAAMIMEPILGARGVIPPPPSFMPKVREICARRGILLIADEVTTRFGRSGDWTGARHGGGQTRFQLHSKSNTQWLFSIWRSDDRTRNRRNI